jgi:hypothetical protein
MAAYPSLLFEFPFGELIKQWLTLRTEFEQGYVQTRAKNTGAPRLYGPNAHRHITSANLTTFLDFWDARKGGAEAFDLTDPRTANTYSVRFVGIPTVRRTGPQTYDIENLVFEEAL